MRNQHIMETNNKGLLLETALAAKKTTLFKDV